MAHWVVLVEGNTFTGRGGRKIVNGQRFQASDEDAAYYRRQGSRFSVFPAGVANEDGTPAVRPLSRSEVQAQRAAAAEADRAAARRLTAPPPPDPEPELPAAETKAPPARAKTPARPPAPAPEVHDEEPIHQGDGPEEEPDRDDPPPPPPARKVTPSGAVDERIVNFARVDASAVSTSQLRKLAAAIGADLGELIGKGKWSKEEKGAALAVVQRRQGEILAEVQSPQG